MWDPALYRQFGAERSRPFYELVGRVGATDPGFVADLGCGPGELTAELGRRWPGAEVVGVDSSAEMIAAADAVLAELRVGPAAPRLRFEQADVRQWQPARPVDVIVSNALLQWIEGHESLLPRLVSQLSDGGWLAFQVPGNFGQATHRLLRELAVRPAGGGCTPAWHSTGRPPTRRAIWNCWRARAAPSTRGRRPTCTC